RGLMWAQALDEERLRPRRLCAHDERHAHALLGQHARYLEGVVAAADHDDARAQIDARLPDRGCADMEAARRRTPPRLLHPVQPLLARETRARPHPAG